MIDVIRDAVMGKEATLAAVEELRAKFEGGEISGAALRVFNADGTWEDLAIGGDDDEKPRPLPRCASCTPRQTESEETAEIGVFAGAKRRHRLSANPRSDALNR